MSLPLVASIGVNTLTDVGANLVGSINPQGLSGTYHFAYGPTSGLGTSTPTQSIAATSAPVTVTAQLAGLTAGTTYYFALACTTSGGTVTSAQLTFTPAVPATTTTAPATPIGTPAVAIPHWKFPFTFTASGGIGVVEQDTLEEIASNVGVILACERGSIPEIPSLGRPDMAMTSGPPDPARLIAAVQAQEPRATEQAIVTALDTPGAWQVALTTTYAGSGQ